MTSTNDGKDVKSNQTSGQKGKTYYIELYKSLEARLSGECAGQQRTRVVCEAWRRIHSLCQHSASKTHPHLLTWLQRHTSRTILQTEWQSPKSKDQHSWLEEAIDAFIGECHQVTQDVTDYSRCDSWESQLLHRAKWFKSILSNPWGHPVLKALLDSRGVQPTDDGVLGWLKEERDVMFVTRLRQLAASKCDDLALLLASAVMTRARDCTTVVSDVDQAAGFTEQSQASKGKPSFVDVLREEAGFSTDIWELLTDIEFVLLHKGESRSQCIELAKRTPLRYGPALVERLESRLAMSPREKKLWKNSKDVATLIAQVVVARCMVVPTCGGAARAALRGGARALARLLPRARLPPAAAALAAPAASATHLYLLATAVHKELGDGDARHPDTYNDERKSFVCELYVRAITAGMNELEKLKLKTEKESEARSTEETLSTWFIHLGTLLSSSSRMNYECVLTAFSIHPSASMYKSVEAAPPLAPILKDIQEPKLETNSEFGSWASDSRTQTNLVKTSETLNLKQTQQANVLSTAIFAEGEALGLGAELCQDLAVLISGPRVKTLFWDMDRELLLDSCRKYMERRHGGTRALTTELKYLNLDPRSFQHLPEEVDDENDAFYGIEKGYEHLVEYQEAEDIWQDAVSDDNDVTDSAFSLDELPIVIPRRKKKSKRLKYSSDDEIDPLSFGENSKRSEKKERPHSKERSKDRKERKERKDKHKVEGDPIKETGEINEQNHLINEKTDDEMRKKKKKKEQKERKKKEKAEKKLLETKQQIPPSGSLSRLVGIKVKRIPDDINKTFTKSETDINASNNLCITDSDYDSQGKSSLNSEGNDSNVLFDGLFSMDEIKSPEKSIDTIQRPNTIPNLEELRISHSITTNNSFGVSAMPFHAIQTQSYQTNTNNDVREDVKKGIKKLIEFRKNKSSSLVPTKVDNTTLNPKFIPVSNVSLLRNQNSNTNKPVTTNESNLNEPKGFLNKNSMNQLNSLKDGADIIFRNCDVKGNIFEHLILASDAQKLNTTNKINLERPIDKVVNRNTSQGSSNKKCRKPMSKAHDPFEQNTPKTSVIKRIETPSQSQYKEFLKQRSFSNVKMHPKASNLIDTSSQKQLHNVREPSKLVSNSRPSNSRPYLNNVNVTPGIIHRDFMKQSTTKKPQIAQTISDKVNILDLPLEKPRQCHTKGLQIIPCQNTNSVKVPASSPTQNHFQSFLRELQESINAGASKENSEIKLPVSDKIYSSKQVIQQKKVVNAPNTFSRLSYLHKNKQHDGKNKGCTDQTKPISNSSTIIKPNFGINIDKVSHLQSKGEIVISRIEKPKINLKDTTRVTVQMTQNPKSSPSTKNNLSRLNIQHPIISNMLSATKRYDSKAPKESENKPILHKNTVTPVETLPTSTYPSESDERDLHMLLRQQSKMNSSKKQHIAEFPKIIIDSCSTKNTSIKSTLNTNANDIRPKEPVVNETIPSLCNSKTLTDLSIKIPNNKSTLPEQKKLRNIKGCTKNPKQTKNNVTSDWESVMNALLAHKTPSRGPNALDIALKKDSFENKSANIMEKPNSKTIHSGTDIRTSIDSANLRKVTTQSNSPVVSCGNIILPNTHTTQPHLKQKQEKKTCTKNKNVELERTNPLNLIEKHFPDVIQNTNDPFISGIPNSDYDLLEELMDDDLRKEIGELMSEEEAYGTLAQTPKPKNVLNDKSVNSFSIKHPNQKLNIMSTEKTATADSCQKLNLLQNNHIIFTPKSTINVPLECNRLNKPGLQMKSNTTTTTNTLIVNKKPLIISNELITSPIINQPGHFKTGNVTQQLKKPVLPENNNLNTNIDRNTMSTSSILPNASIKTKIEDLPGKEVKRTNTDNMLNNKNIALDPTRVILTVPQRTLTPNIMFNVGNELICNSFSTVKRDQSNVNTYVPVNQAPNLTLYRTTQLVAPCVNPIVMERSTTAPVIQMVTPNKSIDSSANATLKPMNSETEKNLTYVKIHEEKKVAPGDCQGNKQKIVVPKSSSEKSENKIEISNTFCGTPEKTKNYVYPNSIENSIVLSRDVLKTKKNTSDNNTLLESGKTNDYNTKLSTKESTHLSTPNSTFNTKHNITANNELQSSSPFDSIPKTKICQENNQHINKNHEKDERDRLQNKRMQIINKQNNHNIYDKPIALSYKSIVSTNEVHKSDKGQNKDKVLKNVILDNKKISSENVDHSKIDIKLETAALPKNMNLNICDSTCQEPSNNSTIINASSIRDSSVSESNVGTPRRRISLRSSLNNSMKFTSPKPISVATTSKVKTKYPSPLKKPLPIQKPVAAKVIKRITKKSKETNSLKQFGKQIKHKIKIKKNDVINVGTDVSTVKGKIENTDSVDRSIDKVNYTYVDIEEQITSAIIPNIFIEKNDSKITPERILNLTENNLTSPIHKDAIVSNLKENAQSAIKAIRSLHTKIESIEKEKREINNIDANKNMETINQSSQNNLNKMENHPTSNKDDKNLKRNAQPTSTLINSLHNEIEKSVEKEKYKINILDVNKSTKTISPSAECKFNTTEKDSTLSNDNDVIQSNPMEHDQTATIVIKSLHNEIEKSVEKVKCEVNFIIANNNTKTISQSAEYKLDTTQKDPTLPKDKDAIQSNLRKHDQRTTIITKSLHKEIEKSVGNEKPEMNIRDSKGIKPFGQAAENKMCTTDMHLTSLKNKETIKLNLRGRVESTPLMMKSLHTEIDKSFEMEKREINITDSSKSIKIISQAHQNEINTTDMHPTSPKNKETIKSNLRVSAESTSILMKSPHTEIEKSFEKKKREINIRDSSKNIKPISQAVDNKINKTVIHPTSPKNKETIKTNLRVSAESTPILIKSHTEIKKNNKKKHESNIRDSSTNIKPISQAVDNKINRTVTHSTSAKSNETVESNLRGRAQSTVMTKCLHSEREIIVKEVKRDKLNAIVNENIKTINQSTISKDITLNKKITSVGISVKSNNVSDESCKTTISRNETKKLNEKQTTERPPIIAKYKIKPEEGPSNKSIDDKLLEYKKKVTIEELPNNKDPLKKIVRIKLPNGNTFKATISGKLNTNVNSLFEDPAVKELLWKNINNKTKCTLNIKQIAIKSDNKTETVVTKVHDISYSQAPITNTETINLVSDDEDSVQTFKTEFGNYNIACMNSNLFLKHQKRLSQKCTVELERCSIFSKLTNLSKDNFTSTLCEDDKDTKPFISQEQASLQENIADFVKIDDSSKEIEITKIIPNAHDKVKLEENIDNLKKSLPKDLDVDDSISNLKNTSDDISDIVDNLLQENVKNDVNEKEISKKCPLKREKCDELIKKMQSQKNMCFVSLVRCDDSLEYLDNNSHLSSDNLKEKAENILHSTEKSAIIGEHSPTSSTIKRSESLSILNDFLVSDEMKSIESSHQIHSCEPISINSAQSQQYLTKCGGDWHMTKYDLYRCYHNKANRMLGSEIEDENISYDDASTDYDSDNDILTSINVPNTVEDNTCIPNEIKYEVPSLIKLTVNYVAENSNIIENLSSICQKNDIQSLKTSPPLKRKLTGVSYNNNRNKILKIENILSPSSDDINKIPFHNEIVSSEKSYKKVIVIKKYMEIVEDKKNNSNEGVANRKEIDEAISQENNCKEILHLNEIDSKMNSEIFHDVLNMRTELNVDLNESILNNLNSQSNISFEKDTNKSFQNVEAYLTVNELSQTELSKEKPDEQIKCHIKPTSIFTDCEIQTGTKITECFDEDKIEVVIPLEKVDVNIQSLSLDSIEELSTNAKSVETEVNKLKGNDPQDVCLNTDDNVKEETYSKEPVQVFLLSKLSSFDRNSETIISNKVIDDIVLNKSAEIFCDANNLQKKNNQKHSINENTDRENDSKVLKNSDVINKKLPNNKNVDDKGCKTSVDSESLQNESKTKSSSDNALQKNVTLVYEGDSSVVLKGSIYEDPVVGTCYVFPILNKSSYDGDISGTCNEKTMNVIQDLKDKVFDDKNEQCDEEENSYNFVVSVPKVTYSRQKIKDDLPNQNAEKLKRKSLKRKSDAIYNKFNEKRYRKGKNIDNPNSLTAMTETSYSKEYKRLFNYFSTLNFSFSRPFHKEYIDVSGVLKCWPIPATAMNIPETTDDKDVLFVDENVDKEGPHDPLQQTLAEEISSKYVEHQLSGDQINEINFSMGFGERSGRVTNISEDGDNISKFSAATLSDVKQSQPFLLSEDYDENTDKYGEMNKFNNDQIDIFKRCVSYIQMRDKVRSFFKKTTLELNYHWLKDNLKNTSEMSVYNNKSKQDFPYDLVSPEFIEPAPVEAVVQVVQVGQLPVSTAAQNPVTCDPRVTQVTDASPSQCSVENSSQDDSQSPIKTEYTELTTADLSLPLVQEYERHMKSQESSKVPICNENIPVEMEVTEIKQEELPTIKDEPIDYNDNDDLQSLVNKHINNVEYSYDSNGNNPSLESQSNNDMIFETLENHNAEFIAHQKQLNVSAEKTDQIAHAMNAAGITTTTEITNNQRGLVNMSPKIGPDASNQVPQANNYSKPAINAISLQQALAQILPPPLNQTNSQDDNQTTANPSATSQVLHIVQGKNSNGNQITLVDNSQNSVINNSNTPVLHIVQNKGVNNSSTSNANAGQHTASYGGLSLVETGLQQGNNQLLHIVNAGNQKNPTTGQLLKRVNLLTNLSNVQGSNDQKMVQFLCKAPDGKSIHLNASHQRSMVLRLQPIESSNIQVNQKSDIQDLSPSGNTNMKLTNNKEPINAQHEIKSRSVYEENYAKFIQSSTNKTLPEKSTSLPKFNQAFGKQVFQDNSQKSNDINSNTSHLSSVNINTESSECQSSEAALNLDHMGQINSPPLLLRKTTSQTTQAPSAQSNLMHQIKQTISPMNIQTMHGGVIYTRQIPVNIGGGQTINLITVPSTELMDENNPKQHNDVKFVNQNEIDSQIIKIVPQNQTPNIDGNSDESLSHVPPSNENSQNVPSHHQPVLTQMRIKLPMLSKAPQMVSGSRVVRPSFFQIQRNVIGGANQPVYQQLVLTAAPPLGQHAIRLPQTPTTRQVKVNSESQSSTESQMSSSTLEQLREFDMVLEQVKERSTVQPNSNVNNSYTKLNTPTSESTDTTSITSTVTESTQQVLYSIGSNQSVNVAYVSRKPNATTPTQLGFVRSPDSSGITESPSSSTHVQIPHTVTSETSSSEGTTQPNQPKAAKVGSKSKSRPKSSHPPNSLKINTVPPKTSTQKPLEDEQTTQRILYILAEYKEQVENSPDKDKPAPRRRSNPPSNPSGSSKRKKSSSGSRRPGRDMSPVHGDETCRTMGSEDSSCTSQGDCTENCLETHSPQDSPRKVVRKLSFEGETNRSRPQPQRNVIVADGQTITVARGTAGKPTTAVLMPANYILPVSMVKGGQQIAIVTNRGPKLLTVGGGEGGATNALLLQRLIGPAGLKPVLARPGVRHVRLPTAAFHNLQAFNLTTATTAHPPDSTASPGPASTPPELIDTRASSSPWTDRDCQDIKPERGSSPEDSESWNLASSADPHDYSYEETVRTHNMDRTVLDAIPDRYSPEMEAQRIFDKMFDVDSKRSYIVDSQDDTSRCAYDIDASDCDDKPYRQVVQRKDGSSHRQHRLTHVSAAALRHKYAILEHELRLQGTAFLQKSLSEECEDLGVDSPSASELFPEAELLFASSPAHDAPQHSHTPQPTILNQSGIPQPDIDDQIATDRLLRHHDVADDQQDLGVTLGLDEGIVTVSEDGMQATIALDQEEFARSHPNTTFHSEPTDEGEVQPFTITGLKGRHITSTIFHAGRAPATVLVTAPQTTVISQATPDNVNNNVKFANINQIINSSSVTHGNINYSSVLVRDDRLTKFDNILTDSRELHLSHTASAIIHSTGNATQVIRRVCYEDDKRDTRFLMDEPEALIAGDDAKMIAEDSSRDATLGSMAGEMDDDNSSPERHTELFWESNSASERSESRRPLDFSSDSEKCCKSPSYDETNSTDSSGVGTHVRLDSVIKDARGLERSCSGDGSSADDTHPPLRTYPAKRMYHTIDGEMERSMSGKTRAGFQEERAENLEVRRRASNRGVVKRGCHCCNGSPAPPRPKKPRQRKPTMDFTSN